MTVITRYPTSPRQPAGLPTLAWETGLSPNRRWVPAQLPADGQPLRAWDSQYGDVVLSAGNPADAPTVATEAGVRFMLTSGAANNGLTVNIADPATMRTVALIARPNTGDTVTGSGRIFRFGDTGAAQQLDADTSTATSSAGFNGVRSLPATRGKWHLYAISLPPVSTVGGNGVFVVDGNSTTFPYSDAAWNASALRIAATAGSGRRLRVAEIITSAESFDAATLIGLHGKAKAWYPALDWAAATKLSEEDEEG